MSERITSKKESTKEIKKITSWAQIAPAAFERRAQEIPKIDQETMPEMDGFKKIERERMENMEKAALAFTIDKKKLEAIELPQHPESSFSATAERMTKAHEDLKATLERIKRLPEKLDFQPGITLIIGENGAGKSTLAKAIFLALKLQFTVRFNKDFAISMSDPEQFKEAAKDAWKAVFNPSTTNGVIYEALFLTQAGLAPEIAKTIELKQADYSEMTEYIDCAQIMGETLALEQTHYLDDKEGRIQGFRGWDYHRSARQTIDERLAFKKRRINPPRHDHSPLATSKNTFNSRIVFVDQPEEGASPRRQRQIQKEMEEFAPEGSITIIPTNSLALFESDLPRIDLDYPERGIFRPSEYPEDQQ